MIKVKYNKDIINISGHALYDIEGKDIVCASVSSIIYTTVNAALKINKSPKTLESQGLMGLIVDLRFQSYRRTV